MTRCGSVKSGVQLTKPVSLTMRLTLLEVAEGELELGEDVDGADAGGLLAVLDAVLAAELADVLLAVGQDGDLAGNEDAADRS